MFSGGVDSPLSRRGAIPDVIDRKIATAGIPARFREDIEKLQEFYGTEFKEGLTIDWSLQQALEILPRERKRVDAYDSLKKYLLETRGIKLTITSNKTK